MDTITQGLLGAAAAQAVFARSLGRAALPIGALAGMAADADVVIPLLVDVVFPHDYHRHFTHALVFIPVGAALSALPFLLAPGLRARAGAVYGAALVGYATHGVLDACTSFGTHLLWPFTARREAWDCLPIVDPIFSLALIVGAWRSFRRRRRRPAVLALIFCVLYALLGVWQNHRALAAQEILATRRGHVVERARALPEPPSLVFWRGLYEHDGRVRGDTLRVLTGVAHEDLGDRDLLRPEDEAAGRPDAAVIADRLRRFLTFTDGWAGPAPGRPDAFGDYRFTRSGDFRALWGVAVLPGEDPPVQWRSWTAGDGDTLELLGDRLRGASFRPVERE